MSEDLLGRTRSRRSVLTVGEVARVCQVSHATVVRWFDTGRLLGYRIPGSKDRRFPLATVEAFLRAYGMDDCLGDLEEFKR